MADVNVPGAGKVNRTWLWAGAAAVAGIVAFAYMRRSGQDTTATEGEYSAGDQWSPDAFSGATAPGGETYDPNDTETHFTFPTTNAEWTQRVVDMLANAGYDITFATATIGKYLSGQALTAAEKIATQAGIAMMGNPPAGALPILSAPEPVVAPPKPASATWRGHRLTADTTWRSLATRYARVPSNPNSVEQTKRNIMAHNPTVVARVGTASGAHLKAGWIVLVPLYKAA
jgi:hypothetical protein